MARFALTNQSDGTPQNLSTAYKTILYVVATTGATTLRRGWIDEVVVGADGLPNTTDCQIAWDWSVTTADGTGTATVPNPTPDGADAAALLTYKANYTAEPTVTAKSTLLAFPTNQRQSQRIQYADYRVSPLIIAATNLKGIVMRAKSTTFASTVDCTEYVVE